jgi:hypothetical protein
MPSAFQSISKRLHAQCFVMKAGTVSLGSGGRNLQLCSDDEYHSAQEIVHGSIVDAVTGDRLICDSGNVRDLRWDRKAEIFEPLPGAKNFV